MIINMNPIASMNMVRVKNIIAKPLHAMVRPITSRTKVFLSVVINTYVVN